MIYEYWFARMKNISDSKKKKLREAYGSAKEIYYIEETQLRLQNFLTKKDIEQLKMARKQKDLEEKYYNMEEKGIDFAIKIYIPEELPIDQCDLGIVVGNALDNAIEATEKSNFDTKKIEIIMGVKKESLVIVVKNPFEGSLRKDKDGNLLSTKDEFYKHGYGINSIIKVAEKYNGDVIIEEEERKFIIMITMNLKDL